MEKKPYKIALYDIDYTIISCNSLSLFTIYIITKKPLKFFILFILFFCLIFWIFKIISAKTVKNIFLILFKIDGQNNLETLSKNFVYEKLIPCIKPDALENIKAYRQKGYKIILATASFEFYMKYLAEYLNADYFFGTKTKLKNNNVLEIEGKNCRGKEKINRILKDISKNLIDKNSSISFSDNLSDLPFLELTASFNHVSMKNWKILKTITN